MYRATTGFSSSYKSPAIAKQRKTIMTNEASKMAGLTAKYKALKPRERLLLKLMGAIAVVLAVAIVVNMVNQSIMELEEETTRYGAALDALAVQGPQFLAAGQEAEGEGFSRADLFTEEVLEDNSVQLTSYVASHASAVDVSVSSYDTDAQPLGSSGEEGGRIIEERQLRADIRNAEMDRFVELLHRLEESREPIVTKRVDIRSVRDEGHVRALLIVSTFEYTDDEES